jgi:hypothetical protein
MSHYAHTRRLASRFIRSHWRGHQMCHRRLDAALPCRRRGQTTTVLRTRAVAANLGLTPPTFAASLPSCYGPAATPTRTDLRLSGISLRYGCQ